MKDYPLDPEEQEFLDLLESGAIKPLKNSEVEKRRYQKIAANTLQQERIKKVNILLSEHDFSKAQERSNREGVSYTDLISNIVHQFFAGQLIKKKI